MVFFHLFAICSNFYPQIFDVLLLGNKTTLPSIKTHTIRFSTCLNHLPIPGTGCGVLMKEVLPSNKISEKSSSRLVRTTATQSDLDFAVQIYKPLTRKYPSHKGRNYIIQHFANKNPC